MIERDKVFRCGEPFEVFEISRIFRDRLKGDGIVTFRIVLFAVLKAFRVEIGTAFVVFRCSQTEQFVCSDMKKAGKWGDEREVGRGDARFTFLWIPVYHSIFPINL